MNPVNLSKVEIKTEDVTNHTAIKKHTIDAILGLPRLGSCLQADDADMDGEIFLHKSNIYLYYLLNLIAKLVQCYTTSISSL